ncbi:40S ribosomal protein S12 [Verticillium dahliae VDG1]|nr:40S ribosomal protein S12 [Verticillium dahliae VDG1]
MLLAEDPATLIHHTIDNFNIQPDKQACARINESLSTLQQARDLRAREAENALKTLPHPQHHDLPTQRPDGLALLRSPRLGNRIPRHAKAADLAARLQELEVQGVDGAADEEARRRRARDPLEDEVLLRLSVYRGLGIEIERDEKEGGGGEVFSRAVVRNDRKGDVHVVNMDKKFSKFFYANYFWQTL